MKKIILTLILLSSLNLYAVNMPYDEEIKTLSPLDEKIEIVNIFYSPYSLSWLENNVASSFQKQFNLFHSDELLSILPLENIIYSLDQDAIKMKDINKNVLIIVYLDDKDKIVDIKRVY